MYAATNSRSSGMNVPVLVANEKAQSDGKAFAKPTHFECVWTDRKTGSDTDGQIYKAIAPAGYVALSHVAIHRSNDGLKPGVFKSADEIDGKFRCVHESLVAPEELGGLRWTDAGSGGTYDGAVWNISNSAGFKAGRGSDNRPPHLQHRLDYIPGPLYKRMQLVGSFENPKEATRPVEKNLTYTIGTTITSSVSSSFREGISSTIGTKASGGVKGIADVEVSVELTTFMEETSSFFSSESQTETVKKSSTYFVDPGTSVELYQMYVSDNKDGSIGLLNMGSDHIKLVVTKR